MIADDHSEVISPQDGVQSSRKSLILNGQFRLQTGDVSLKENWESLLESIPLRHFKTDLPRFTRYWNFSKLDETKWELSDGEELKLELPNSTPTDLRAFLEYAACGEVLRLGGPGALPVHAALVSPSSKGIIAVIGLSTAGKSTTCTALWEEGWQLFSDDRCFITKHDSQNPEAIPIPRRISLRAPAFELLRPETRALILESPFSDSVEIPSHPDLLRFNFRPSIIRPEPEDQSFDLRAIVYLNPELESPEIARVKSASMIKPLLSCTALHRDQNQAETLLPWFSITNTVPLFTMGRSSISHMKDHFLSLAEQLGLTP